MKKKFIIDSDISKAETLPSFFYKNSEIFEDLKSKIFFKSWQYIGDDDLIKEKNSVFPLTILKD
jgi:choline monooxygenase